MSVCLIYPIFQALSEIVMEHLSSERKATKQLHLRCPMCINAVCGEMRDFFLGDNSKHKK